MRQVFELPVAIDAISNETTLIKVTLLLRCLERCRSFEIVVTAILILLCILCLGQDESDIVWVAHLRYIVFLNSLVFLESCRNFQISRAELPEAVGQTRNILAGIKNCGQEKHVLALYYLDGAFEVFVAGRFDRDYFPDSFHYCL